jgi:hypothetical protein
MWLTLKDVAMRVNLPVPFPFGSLGTSVDPCAAPSLSVFWSLPTRTPIVESRTQRRKTMNDSVTTPAGNGTNKPSHIAYQVRDGKDKGFWTRIGVAWTSRDEKGFVIQLNAIPLDGKIVLRLPDPKDAA